MPPGAARTARHLALTYALSALLGGAWYLLDRHGPNLSVWMEPLGDYYSPLEILDENAPLNLVLASVLTTVLMAPLLAYRRATKRPTRQLLTGTWSWLHGLSVAALFANAIFYLPHHAVWFGRPRGVLTLAFAATSGALLAWQIARADREGPGTPA